MAERSPQVEELRERFEQRVEQAVIPLILELGLGEYWLRHQQLLAADHLAPQLLAAEQWDRLSELVAEAAQTVPVYRDALAERGLSPHDLRTPDDLSRLPPIDKRTILANFPDRITSAASDRATWRYRSTSGTAFRIMSVTDFDARQWRYALHLRSMKLAADYAVGQRQVVIRTQACTEVCAASDGEEFALENAAALPVEREWPPFGLAQLTLQESQLKPLAGRAATSEHVLDDYLDQLDRLTPFLLRGLPQYLLRLARRLRATDRTPPQVGRIVVQDSLAPAEIKREIADAFGCPVRETYGASELGSMAAECEAGALHLASSAFWVEALRPDGTAAAAGETGILAVTSLVNRAMPLIRYRLGDLGSLISGACACGRTTPRIRVEGRVQEALVQGANFITARQFYQTLAGVQGVLDFQVIEKAPGRLEIHVVPAAHSDFAADDLIVRVQALVGEDTAIQVRRVPWIGPEESGKFALVKTLPREFVPREN